MKWCVCSPDGEFRWLVCVCVCVWERERERDWVGNMAKMIMLIAEAHVRMTQDAILFWLGKIIPPLLTAGAYVRMTIYGNIALLNSRYSPYVVHAWILEAHSIKLQVCCNITLWLTSNESSPRQPDTNWPLQTGGHIVEAVFCGILTRGGCSLQRSGCIIVVVCSVLQYVCSYLSPSRSAVCEWWLHALYIDRYYQAPSRSILDHNGCINVSSFVLSLMNVPMSVVLCGGEGGDFRRRTVSLEIARKH